MAAAYERDRTVATEVLKLLPELGKALVENLPEHATGSRASVAQMKAVIHLAEYGPQTMTDLATGLGITTPSATGLINPLVDMGYVVRERDTRDRRVVRVQLSESSRLMADTILKQRHAEVERALEGMTPEAQANFLEGLRRLAAAYGNPRPGRSRRQVASA
jgi:DNA-binding MarR family transcriptional regulator